MRVSEITGLTYESRKAEYRLYPSRKQKLLLAETLELSRQLYNAALEERIGAYKTGKSLNYYDQSKSLSIVRKENIEYKQIYSQSGQLTLKRLELAYKAFFSRVKKGQKAGFPRFKSRNAYRSFGFPQHNSGWKLTLNKKGGNVSLFEIGLISLRGQTRFKNGVPKTCDVVLKNGKWYLSVCFDVDSRDLFREHGDKAFAFDLGLRT